MQSTIKLHKTCIRRVLKTCCLYTALIGLGSWRYSMSGTHHSKKTCQEMKGIKYMGRWAPNNACYHWCYIFETDEYGKPPAALNKARPGYTRDYNKVTHSIVEVYSGPLDKTKL